MPACRYALLHEYGGFYIDLDIECRRPLDFLRPYPFVMPATKPVGFSNDFLAAEPRHPLMAQMLKALPAWRMPLITKYPTVMFSTGPMFVTLQARSLPLHHVLLLVVVSRSAGQIQHVHVAALHAGACVMEAVRRAGQSEHLCTWTAGFLDLCQNDSDFVRWLGRWCT